MTATPATLTARTPDDVLAMVPVVLGFVPTESVAMLTFGAARPFHARVDLPRARDEIPEVVSSLLDPARGHGVRRALFVVYTGDARMAAATVRALSRAFERSRIDVVDALRADGERWYPAVGTRPGVPPWGVRYDVSAHPFLARAVVDGRVTYTSREELARDARRRPGRHRPGGGRSGRAHRGPAALARRSRLGARPRGTPRPRRHLARRPRGGPAAARDARAGCARRGLGADHPGGLPRARPAVGGRAAPRTRPR